MASSVAGPPMSAPSACSGAWACPRRNARSRAIPHQFSGGMRQRVMLTIGFGNQPSLIIADEPTTALDVTIQREILHLLQELNAELRDRHPAHHP